MLDFTCTDNEDIINEVSLNQIPPPTLRDPPVLSLGRTSVISL